MRSATFPKPLTGREEHVLDTAVKFTAVRGLLSNRVKVERNTLEECLLWAEQFGDGRTMIYAVNSSGGQAHVRNA